jgi:hypothetical protein
LVPFVVAPAAAVLLVAPARAAGAPPALRSVRRLATLAALVAVAWLGPKWTAAAVDARFFDNAWNSLNGAVDTARMRAPLLPATPAANSVGQYFVLDGPLTVKKQIPLVGDINIWGEKLDRGPGLRWSPAEAGPSWYEQRFATPAAVTDVTVRVWGLPRERGAFTPTAFRLAALGPHGTSHVVRNYPDPADAPVLLGKYLAFHYRFEPPLECTGLRLDIPGTVGGKPPVLLDFQAFGTSPKG